MLVWVDEWQMACCGEPFEVGSRVEWTLYTQENRDWLAAVVGDELAHEVTHGEEHHGGVPDDLIPTVGRVTRIRAVRSRFGPDPNSVSAANPILVPVSGTTRLMDVSDADGRSPWPTSGSPANDDMHFSGYLVDLHQMEDQ